MTNEQAKQEQLNWLDEELKQTGRPTFEQLPSLKLMPNKLVEIEVDFSKPFQKWTGTQGKKEVTKAIIPVVVNGEKLNFWLNVRNPLYHTLCEKGKAGTNKFKIIQIGVQDDTKYNLVE